MNSLHDDDGDDGNDDGHDQVMDMWGKKMLDAVVDVARMAAEGFGLPPNR